MGNGRVAIPVALATGRTVIGVDSSPAMLAQARAGAAAASGVALDLREGDIRDLAVEEPAALIYCPYRRSAARADVGRSPAHVRAGSTPPCAPVGCSRGTSSCSTTTSPSSWTAGTRTHPCR